jgi:hypothetical protein
MSGEDDRAAIREGLNAARLPSSSRGAVGATLVVAPFASHPLGAGRPQGSPLQQAMFEKAAAPLETPATPSLRDLGKSTNIG